MCALNTLTNTFCRCSFSLRSSQIWFQRLTESVKQSLSKNGYFIDFSLNLFAFFHLMLLLVVFKYNAERKQFLKHWLWQLVMCISHCFSHFPFGIRLQLMTILIVSSSIDYFLACSTGVWCHLCKYRSAPKTHTYEPACTREALHHRSFLGKLCSYSNNNK